MTPRVRPETPGDIVAVHAVHLAAFPTDGEARLVDAMRRAGHASVSLVAELETEVVGHVLFSPVKADSGSSVPGVGLAPVAVRPEHQRQGIGAVLIEAGIQACRSAGYGYAVVLGDPRYYERFGFRRASAAGLENEYGVDEEFMVLQLEPGTLRRIRGLVKYRPEFALLG